MKWFELRFVQFEWTFGADALELEAISKVYNTGNSP